MLDIGHALDPAREDAIGDAGLDHHRRGSDRLEARSATPVELEAGNLLGIPCGKPTPVADRRGLAAAIALAEDDVVDPSRVDPAAFDERLDDHRAELAGFERCEAAEKSTDRGAQGLADGNAAK